MVAAMEPEILLQRVERYLRRTGMTPSSFGLAVANDPRLVFMMRKGREPRKSLRDRILAKLRAA